jgi:hypothetical protein
MKPASYTVGFTIGDDVSIPFRYRTRVWNVTTQTWDPGPAVDLTGWTARCQFRPTYDSTTFVEAAMMIDADQVANTGFFYLSLSSVQTLGMGSDWVYDIELINAAGFKQTYISGKTKAKAQATHD